MSRERAPRPMRLAMALGLALAGAATAAPALARVEMANERGFVVQLTATAPATPEEVWAELVKPADWWDSDHSFSGDAANFTLDPTPGGCFCETLPGEKGGLPRGGVEHMRVVYVEKPRALRMRGALGPLQGDALVGTLTVQLKPAGDSTQILWEYVVGGFTRASFDAMSASVDKVLGEQLARLAAKLGAKPDAPAPPPAADSKPADDNASAKSEIIGR